MKDLKTIKYIIIAAGVIASAAFYIRGGVGPGSIGYEILSEEEEHAEFPDGTGEMTTAAGYPVSSDSAGLRLTPEPHMDTGVSAGYTAELSEEQMEKLAVLIRTAVREELTALTEEGYLEAALKEAAEYKAAEEEAHRGLVNLNTADRSELMTLPGIGEKKAGDIMAYRTSHGAFQSVEEIMQVSGIKAALFEKIRDRVYV